MPTIREMNAGAPKRLIVRIAMAIAFVVAVALYLAHAEYREGQQVQASAGIVNEINRGSAPSALALAASALQSLGETADLKRAAWSSLMAGGGRDGSKALLRRTFAYSPQRRWIPGGPHQSWLSFSNDGRFLAAIDGPTITVWNVDDGAQVATTTAADRFVGFFRIGPRFFGLLASYQFYDLVSDVISLPENYRYAQPSKDALTAVAPGGDWAYRVPDWQVGRTDYPIMLVNLHTGEKREVDVNYRGGYTLAINRDATRLANLVANLCDPCSAVLQVWNTRSRQRVSSHADISVTTSLYFSSAQDALIASSLELPTPRGGLEFLDPATGQRRFELKGAAPIFSVADDPDGKWFAIQTDKNIELYRGPNSPWVATIAEREVSRAPATSR